MNPYIDLLLITCIVVFIVDLSGFTQTWLGWLSRFTARYGYPPVQELRPFSCSLCMTWWTGLAYALITHTLSIAIVAYIAALSFSSITLTQLFIFIRETMLTCIRKIDTWLNKD